MPAHLPVIVGFGGVNPAGRQSFHHAYRRMVIEALGEAATSRTFTSLASLMGRTGQANDPNARAEMLDGTLIRGLNDAHENQMRWHTALPHDDGQDELTFQLSARQLPEVLPR